MAYNVNLVAIYSLYNSGNFQEIEDSSKNCKGYKNVSI